MNPEQKEKILVFAGTTEGRRVCEFLNRSGITAIACTATEYGGQLLEEDHLPLIRVLSGRMTSAEMENLILEKNISIVIDATHPYADIVSENILKACREVRREIVCIRLLRESLGGGEKITVSSVSEAVKYLQNQAGNILVTTGSKQLHEYTQIPDYRTRVFARILSTETSVKTAVSLGFEGKNLICMQGPFSEEMNEATIRMTNARFLVTKESGIAGGFPEKEEAARKTNTVLIVVRRPSEMKEPEGEQEPVEQPGLTKQQKQPGQQEQPERLGQTGKQVYCEHDRQKRSEGCIRKVFTERETLQWLARCFGLEKQQKITLAGIGMGHPDGMTEEVRQSIREADLLAGAERMVRAGLQIGDKPYLITYQAKELQTYLEVHPEIRKVTVLLSGDSGFYSGARKLREDLQGYQIRILPGISSVSYLAARTCVSWEDAKIVSIHGRQEPVISAIRRNRKVFLLLSGRESLQSLCSQLLAFGLENICITVGENLSYPDERIVSGTPRILSELSEKMRIAESSERKEKGHEKGPKKGQEIELNKITADASLLTVLIQNDHPDLSVSAGFPDTDFSRGTAEGRIVPMTKSEVRAVVLSKLRLRRNSIVYDIGAGTGSVSVECARLCGEGKIFAIERKSEALDLVRSNIHRFGTDQVEPVLGNAPEVLENLPMPTHAFLGGTAGNMSQILETLLKKNPKIRVVITAVALETLTTAQTCLKNLPFTNIEIVSLTIARAEKTGPYSMMKGLSPVWILAADGSA